AVADRGAITMARRLHAHLHRLFRWAVGRGIIETNPMAHLPKPGSEVKRDRVLTDAELALVWNGSAKIGWPFGSILQLLILTGARREEIRGVHWSEIKGDTIILGRERTKGDQAHSIPLAPAAVEIIKALPRIGEGDLVFTTNGRTPVSGFSKIKRRFDGITKI